MGDTDSHSSKCHTTGEAPELPLGPAGAALQGARSMTGQGEGGSSSSGNQPAFHVCLETILTLLNCVPPQES